MSLHDYLFAIVLPWTKLHIAVLMVEWEVANIEQAVPFEVDRGCPHDSPIREDLDHWTDKKVSRLQLGTN